MRTWRIAGINFEHFHMGDNLRFAQEHPRAEIVGICDEQVSRMQATVDTLSIPAERIFADWQECLRESRPDVVIACPSAATHGIWAERLMAHRVHVMMEKPMAASLPEADRMMQAAKESGCVLAINWPMAWYPAHRMAYRLIQSGLIGSIREVHYYDGNRGPLWHSSDKRECTPEEVEREKPHSWFYKKALGGGSLLDYLGYGTTLGTWFNGGAIPEEVTAVVDQAAGLEVDEHAIVIARYGSGLSKFETRWGTFTDPWTHQPQPKCGFVIVGSEGTLSCYDGEKHVRVQTRDAPQGRDIPADSIPLESANPVAYLLDCLENGRSPEGPMSLETSYIGQRIVDSALLSAQQRRTVPLL